MKRQYMSDSMGSVDSDGIAQWYPNSKVRFDGSHYIATPHTTNPVKRTKRTEERISVTINNGKYELEDKSKKAVEIKDQNTNESKKKRMTRKQIFDELYDKYLYMKPKERKKAIYADMKPLFKNETDLQTFIEDNCSRRWRNLIVRRQRFARKAYNQHFQWFVTFTYSDELHTEESFKQRLLEAL